VKPVFYDPVKEAKENRVKESGFSDDQPGSELRMRMQLRMNRKKTDELIRKRSRRMSIIFSVLLMLLILYYIFL